jgi:hypothetical protein
MRFSGPEKLALFKGGFLTIDSPENTPRRDRFLDRHHLHCPGRRVGKVFLAVSEELSVWRSFVKAETHRK